MLKTENNFPCLLVISGATASGKTYLTTKLAKILSSEIINADIGQFYTPLCIGTAKPDWKNEPVKHHLFDIIDTPKDLSVFEYRKLVLKKANEIFKKGKLPIIVGGSLFYLKSLYFPPKDFEFNKEKIKSVYNKDLDQKKKLWEILYKIDSQRAIQLHYNDTYRITRALEIWEKTGIKPSEYKPEFYPNFHSLFIFISLSKNILEERINKRTEHMFQKYGWINEVKSLVGTEWEEFIKRKGFIGYSQILDWIENGCRNEDLAELVKLIQQKTRQYSKKQITFYKGFKKLLQKEDKSTSKFICKILEVEDLTDETLAIIIKSVRKIFKFIVG
ncbi:tRNA (adenosine(37)-N6)-dimethylallyltransferase MiaA [Candidatus Babeliales bacterium]|nr:tRNA (adenosine(37)-N6)-dimethylallyltransferase MiaA [Candidatus Babeliales bacterium]